MIITEEIAQRFLELNTYKPVKSEEDVYDYELSESEREELACSILNEVGSL